MFVQSRPGNFEPVLALYRTQTSWIQSKHHGYTQYTKLWSWKSHKMFKKEVRKITWSKGYEIEFAKNLVSGILVRFSYYLSHSLASLKLPPGSLHDGPSQLVGKLLKL